MSPSLPSTRRDFLLRSAAASAALLVRHGLAAQAAPAPPTPPARDTLLKFSADGKPKPFAGNTVICHLPVQCAMRDEMARLHEALATSSFRDALGLTSVDSYHMTIFSGANDQDRSVTGWPSYVPLDAPIEVCNQMVQERMSKASLHCELPLRVRVDPDRTLGALTALSLRMVPIDAEETRKLRSVRDQLADLYGFRSKGHDTYQLHITMSYQVHGFLGDQRAAYRQMLSQHLPRIISAAPIVELGVPEYCTFADMFRFEPKLLLRCA